MKNKVFRILISVLVTFTLVFASSSSALAGVRCRPDNCSSCDVRPNGDTKWGEGPGSYRVCCACAKNNKGCDTSSNDRAGCGNCGDFIDKPPQPPECSCTPIACPPSSPTKFMQKPVSSGTATTCADKCNPQHPACTVYRNTPPSCSILPSSIEMVREDAPKKLQLAVTDLDYGDSVNVVGVKVVDAASVLNSCVKVTNVNGGSLLGAIVHQGGNDASFVTQLNDFIIDARESHGVYENIGGESLCKGKIIIEIADEDSDLSGGVDVSDSVKCEVAISVKNKAPMLEDVVIQDLSEGKRETSDNLIDGRAKLIAGSVLSSATKLRASYCRKPLSLLTNPVQCLGGDEEYISFRRNPLKLSFTVSDGNGKDDIMQGGVWIQNNTQGTSIAFPPVSSGARSSFQARYSEQEMVTFRAYNDNQFFLSRACFTPSCGQTSLETSNKLVLTGLGYIPLRGQLDSAGNGNISSSGNAYSTYKTWQKVGYPDCIGDGCSQSNVPAASQATLPANASVTSYSSYDWFMAADSSHLICYQNTTLVPKVVAAGNPVYCPNDCAACVKRESVVADSAYSNALKFTFSLYFNDLDGGQGMPSGDYSLYLSVLDKVGATLNNVTDKGHEGWTTFDKAGTICLGATCPNGSTFVLNYDSIPPVVTVPKFTEGTGEEINITATLTDAGGSGIAGISNRYITKQPSLDGEPTGDAEWAQTLEGLPFDGAGDIDYSTSGQVTFTGKGFTPGDFIIGGLCAFDNAGNMACGRSNNGYTFRAPWVKTSFGDIFSNKAANASPFVMTLPSNTEGNDDSTKRTAMYAPYTEQIFTIGTGLFMTNAASTQLSGIAGGAAIGASLPQAQVGFTSGTTKYYRAADSGSSFNLFETKPVSPGNEFARLKAVASLNCDLMNQESANVCQSNGQLTAIGENNAPYKLIEVGSATTGDITCTNANIIFVSGNFTVKGSVKKANAASGCLFVVGPNAKLTIADAPSNTRTYAAATPAPNEKGNPTVDTFEAAVVLEGTAQFTSAKSLKAEQTNLSVDRLEMKGWLYASGTTPLFLRDLASVDNRRFPAEWIVYDATLLDVLRPLLGNLKTVDILCGTSSHILCK